MQWTLPFLLEERCTISERVPLVQRTSFPLCYPLQDPAHSNELSGWDLEESFPSFLFSIASVYAIRKNLQPRTPIGVVFLAIESAFDALWQERLAKL